MPAKAKPNKIQAITWQAITANNLCGYASFSRVLNRKIIQGCKLLPAHHQYLTLLGQMLGVSPFTRDDLKKLNEYYSAGDMQRICAPILRQMLGEELAKGCAQDVAVSELDILLTDIKCNLDAKHQPLLNVHSTLLDGLNQLNNGEQLVNLAIRWAAQQNQVTPDMKLQFLHSMYKGISSYEPGNRYMARSQDMSVLGKAFGISTAYITKTGNRYVAQNGHDTGASTETFSFKNTGMHWELVTDQTATFSQEMHAKPELASFYDNMNDALKTVGTLYQQRNQAPKNIQPDTNIELGSAKLCTFMCDKDFIEANQFMENLIDNCDSAEEFEQAFEAQVQQFKSSKPTM